jgi:hypothetical protein
MIDSETAQILSLSSAQDKAERSRSVDVRRCGLGALVNEALSKRYDLQLKSDALVLASA